jgi:hypothetical protein
MSEMLIDNSKMEFDDELTIDDLDTSWLDEFENLDKEYKDYYTEELLFIRCHFVYINKTGEIEKIREQTIHLSTPGLIKKEELIPMIKHNMVSNDVKYRLLSILKYNINFDPIHLRTFLKTKNDIIGSSFLSQIDNIDTIKLDKSISMFHDINDIFILFHEKETTASHVYHFTKKRHFNTNNKTKRKQFKELRL